MSAGFNSASPQEIRLLVEKGDGNLTLLDVRTIEEYASYHIPDSLLIPMDELQARLPEIPKDKAVVVLCEHGVRSAMVAEYLASLGYPEVMNMAGGLSCWDGQIEMGLPA